MKTALLIIVLTLILGLAGAEPYVQVTYAEEPNDISYSTLGVGKEFLLVNTIIANHGYDEVAVGPANVDIMVNNVIYDFDAATLYLNKIGKPILDTARLADGGLISGYLVFQIPAGTQDWELILDIGDQSKNVKYTKSTAWGSYGEITHRAA